MIDFPPGILSLDYPVEGNHSQVKNPCGRA